MPIRFVHLNGPFTGSHEFRQTQTALSVWEIREHGVSVLHPRLPLFGPPWECPFEYPVFQLVAAGLDSIAPWKNLDVSIRLANLFFYYLTALTLFLLTRLLFTEAGVALFTAAVFLFSPYHIFWSRSSMIEYAATFFALAYLVTFIRWTFKPGRALFMLCVCFGVLGCLTKITTFVIPLFIGGTLTGLCALRLLMRKRKTDKELARLGPGVASHGAIRQAGSQGGLRPVHIVLMVSMLLAPLSVGYSYARFSDKIKEASPYTAWLSSKHPFIKAWIYGTVNQRLSLNKWSITLHRMQETVMPWLTIALGLGFCALPFRIRGFQQLPQGNFWIGCALALAPLVPMVTFYNLYWVHSYYFVAGAPLLALFAGVGLWLVFDLIKDRRIKILFIVLLCGVWLQTSWPEVAQMVSTPRTDARVGYLTEAAKLMNKDEPVIILSAQEWSPFAPYYLKRRAFMAMLLHKPVNMQPLLDTDYFKEHGFRWLLVEGSDPSMSELATKILGKWKRARKFAVPAGGPPYVLYSLSDE